MEMIHTEAWLKEAIGEQEILRMLEDFRRDGDLHKAQELASHLVRMRANLQDPRFQVLLEAIRRHPNRTPPERQLLWIEATQRDTWPRFFHAMEVMTIPHEMMPDVAIRESDVERFPQVMDDDEGYQVVPDANYTDWEDNVREFLAEGLLHYDWEEDSIDIRDSEWRHGEFYLTGTADINIFPEDEDNPEDILSGALDQLSDYSDQFGGELSYDLGELQEGADRLFYAVTVHGGFPVNHDQEDWGVGVIQHSSRVRNIKLNQLLATMGDGYWELLPNRNEKTLTYVKPNNKNPTQPNGYRYDEIFIASEDKDRTRILQRWIEQMKP